MAESLVALEERNTETNSVDPEGMRLRHSTYVRLPHLTVSKNKDDQVATSILNSKF